MQRWIRRSVGLFVCVSTLALSGAAWADDLLLKLEGIKGESTRQKDEIDISSFSWGFAQPDAGGRPVAQRFIVQKHVDAASPALVQHLLDGRSIANATFVVRRPSADKASIVIQIDLKDARVVDLQLNGNDSARPVESVALSFSKLTYQYFPLDKSGKPGPAVVASWSGTVQKR